MFLWKKRPTVEEFFGDSSEEGLECILRVRRFIYRLVGDSSTAEDLTQEVMMVAIRKWEQRTHDDVLPWVIAIAKNHTYDYFRKNNARQKKAPMTALSEEHIDTLYERSEENQILDEITLHTALRVLSLDARVIVILKLEGYTNREIAHIRGCSEEKARKDVREALRTVRDSLKLGAMEACL